MTPDELRRWTECKERIASCRECLDRWAPRIEQPLGVDEIPDPRPPVSILFVGVAPPPVTVDADDEGGHFYSNPCDRLRLGVFHIIDRLFTTDLTKRNRESREAGTTAFLDAGFFFLHAAKVRPCRGRLAPTRRVMRFCARRHLAEEICLLKPRGICFLGTTNASPAAEAVCEHALGAEPQEVEVRCTLPSPDESWRGQAIATVQPVRGTKEGRNRERAATAVPRLRDALAASLR